MTQQHYDRFVQLVERSGHRGKQPDALPWDYTAAFYLMSCKSNIFEKTCKYVNQDGIAFNLILRMDAYDFDLNCYMELLRLAACLFRSEPVKNLDCSAFSNLGIQYAIRAMLIRELGPMQYLQVDT